MKIKSLLGAVALAATALMTTVSSSSATTVWVYGKSYKRSYDITTITGTFLDNRSLLEAQEWWGNHDSTVAFATAVSKDQKSRGFTDGTGLFDSFLATRLVKNFYGYEYLEGWVPDYYVDAFLEWGHSPQAESRFVIASQVAVAPVPLPAGGLLLLTGVAGVAAINRRKKRAA